jgi:hypothetical protein
MFQALCRKILSPRFLIGLALAVWLSGCKLIDQTTFAPDPEAAAVPAARPAVAAPAQAVGQAAAPRPANRAPLVAIRYDTENPDFRELLAYAIRAAEQRRPGGDYDVVAASTASEAVQAGRDAASVMVAMKALGVAEGRMHLGARIEPGLTAREVRVFLQ